MLKSGLEGLQCSVGIMHSFRLFQTISSVCDFHLVDSGSATKIDLPLSCQARSVPMKLLLSTLTRHLSICFKITSDMFCFCIIVYWCTK